MFAQLLLIAAVLLLALHRSGALALLVALGALLVAAMSATQDIVVDAFRVESLPQSEQAAGMASFVAAYRVGMLASTIGALHFVSGFEARTVARPAAWTAGYLAMASLVLVGVATTLVATEPDRSAASEVLQSGAARCTGWCMPLAARLLSSSPARWRWCVLAFVMLYKFCDAFAGAMTAPFVIDLGFSRTDYANIVKGVGLAATLIGGFAGGYVARVLPLTTCLWIGGFPADGYRTLCSRGRLGWAQAMRRWRSRSPWRISPAPSAP